MTMVKWFVLGVLGIGLFFMCLVFKKIAIKAINGFEAEEEDNE